MNPFLICTDDYSRFAPYKFNRDVAKVDKLTISMKKFGFHPGSPIDCVPSKDGMLLIRQGHHRFEVATQLGIKLWAVVNNHQIAAHELEIPAKSWSMKDFVVAHAKSGNKEMMELLHYAQKHSISLNMSASVLRGNVSGGSNYREEIKDGLFKASGIEYANHIAEVVEQVKSCGVPFANNSNFVRAIGRAVRIPNFDRERFCKKCIAHPYLITKRASVQGYMETIETIYNRQCSPKDKIAIVVEAAKVMEQRGNNFRTIKGA